jgi:hypothetical protein
MNEMSQGLKAITNRSIRTIHAVPKPDPLSWQGH